MEAIRKIALVNNNSLTLNGLEKLNNRKVEVIILPHNEMQKKTGKSLDKKISLKGKVTKYINPFDPAIAENEWEINN